MKGSGSISNTAINCENKSNEIFVLKITKYKETLRC